MNIIEIKNAKVFRGNTLALENFELTIALGEHHAILGANGAGKSTCLKLITRELHPVVNEQLVYRIFDQERPTIWSLREKIGIVSQDFQESYLALATGLDVVVSGLFGSVGLHQHQSISMSDRSKALGLMEKLGIASLAEKQYLQLSTGQQRRLIFARALVHKPQALILDEPTNGLDIQAKFWFLNTIRKLATEGISIILVTHDPLEIIPEIHNVTLLKQGKIQFSGNKQEAMTEDKLRETYNVSLCVEKLNNFYQLSPK
jgi:iron complex transport system ATP-binding protein